MLTFVAIIHLVFCFILVLLVLLQDPKGGAAGIFGGGGGGANSLLGATGQTTFFSKLTKWSAVIFGITCITMTIITRSDAGSVIDASPSLPAPIGAPAAAPAASGAPTAAGVAPNVATPGAPAPGPTNEGAQEARGLKKELAPASPAPAQKK